MSIALLLRRAAALRPHLLVREAGGFALRRTRAGVQRWNDQRRPSYAADVADGPLHGYVRLTAGDIPDDLVEALSSVVALTLNHRFDLLGSGWTDVHYGMRCRGLEGVRYEQAPAVDADRDGRWLSGRVNPANLAEARRLWQLLDLPGYRPIDWQIDFKSGYRWREEDYFLDIEYGGAAGADIKLPWELARMQHLPWLAIACLLARAGLPGFAPAARYAEEVRSQILDFLATNPPRFGVNWRCPMDVAIRIANWLLALDILMGAGIDYDAPFCRVVKRGVLEHARHIAAHLEWSEAGRSNHYLANIAGLLFAAAYLPRTAETDAWLAFAIQQLDVEIGNQFGVDGGNFEGSTAYHCLSAEMAVYAMALVLGLPEEKLAALSAYDHRAIQVRPPFRSGPMRPPTSFPRIAAMADFLRATTKPSGGILQVGDTDSGRLFKLHPVWHGRGASGPDEDILDRRALADALDALVAAPGVGKDWLDGRVVRILSKGRRIAVAPADVSLPPTGDLSSLLEAVHCLPPDSRRVTEFPIPEEPGWYAAVTCAAFPLFGLFVLHGPRFFLSLRCASYARTDAPSGHTHDDNLAVELHAGGRDVIVDPGSYLYTSFPDKRAAYRSADAHFAPRPAGRPATTPVGLFDLRHIARAVCLHCGTDGIAGRLDGPGWQAWRIIELIPGAVRITDACAPGPLASIPADPPAITAGYGKSTESPAYSF
jgi:hypothetical protein